MRAPAGAYDPLVQRRWVEHLRRLALVAWCRESSEDPLRWTPELPEYAQCGATALIVQDVLGGGLMTGRYQRGDRFVTHCWNLVGGDAEVDLTRRQMRGARLLGTSRVTREAVLAHAPTAHRYAFLAARFVAAERAGRRR